MDWSKTKTIFIVIFLVLDLFLLTVYVNKHSASQFEIIEETSVEEKLKTDDIKYSTLPEVEKEAPLVTAKTKVFSKRELILLDKQKITLSNDRTTLSSELEKPIELGEEMEEASKKFVKNYVLYGDKYGYWAYEKEENKIIFYQQFKGKKLFENINGQLVLQLNSKGELISYEQTLLEQIEENGQEDVLPAIQAIQTLYKNGVIKPHSRISNAEFGYYTLVQLTESQVLSPTWYFKVRHKDEEEHIFVNAFDGTINQTGNESK